MTLLLRFLPHIVAVVAIVGAGWWLRHSGYVAGQAERTAHYQPILDKINVAGIKAQAESKAKEEELAGRVSTLEQSLNENLSAQREAAVASGQRMARLVQSISRCRAERVPETPADPSRSRGSPGVAERLQQVAVDLAGVADAAQRDAIRLGACQDILRDERAVLAR